jgi:hypothetical protein
MRLKAILVSKSGNKLWGIYYADREYAQKISDPPPTVVEARTKLAAEDEAARLGFGDPWAHPVTTDQASQAQWRPVRRTGRPQKQLRTSSRSFRVQS